MVIGRFMPTIIRSWITTVPVTVKKSWPLFTEALNNQFGKNSLEESREIKSRLKKLKQAKHETIKLHSAKWKHLLSLLNANEIDNQSQKILYIQSLFQDSVRTLLANNPSLDIYTLIHQSIIITEHAGLESCIQSASQETSKGKQIDTNNDVQPMEIDYFGRFKHRIHSKWKKMPHASYNKQHNIKPQQQGPPRLYDKQGRAICGYCKKLHRTIDCNQYSKTSQHRNVNNVEVNNSVDITNPTVYTVDVIHASSTINHLQKFRSSDNATPISDLMCDGKQVTIMWDTGAQMDCMAYDLAIDLKLPFNADDSITYNNVDLITNQTAGTVELKLFGEIVKFNVLQKMTHKIIIGSRTVWDFEKQTMACIINNNKYLIKYRFATEQSYQVSLLDIQPSVDKLLELHKSVIANNTNKPSITNLVEFSIDTGTAQPIYTPPRRHHPQIQQQIDDKFEELQENGIVTKVTHTEWGSPVTAVPKPDKSLRICGNYVRLNAITVTVKYPFVNLHIALQSMGKAKIFSKIDLASGYYQMKIKEEDKAKTALVTTNGTYIFNFMSFGLKNAPAYFQSLMDLVLGPLQNRCVIAYLDDIIIYSNSAADHLRDLEQVLIALSKANLSINRAKSAFGLASVEYLGFVVSTAGILPNLNKIKPILAIPPPSNLKELESVLGVFGVYQRFITKFQITTEPLRRLKKKDAGFVWNKEQQEAFTTLKEQLSSLPLLKQHDFNKTFELHVDGAATADIGVVLCQRYNGSLYPLSFVSRALTIHEQRYSVREIEALSIIWDIKKHRIYLEAGHFLIFTDHSSLQWLMSTSEDKQPRLWRWCLFL